MHQLPFPEFDHMPVSGESSSDGESQTGSVDFLAAFRSARLLESASLRSVDREVSQIRAVVRECRRIAGTVELAHIFTNPALVATALSEPSTPISRSTGRSRLIAVQRFIRLISVLLGDDAGDALARLDALLPSKSVASWHSVGTLVAGTRRRQRRRGPTLGIHDIHRILYAAAQTQGRYATRNRALVGLHCFSGLRPEEIVALTWQHLNVEGQEADSFALSVSVTRQSTNFKLPLPRQAADPLMALASSYSGTVASLTGAVFRPHNGSRESLSYRTARDILKNTCSHAGFPTVEAVDLRAAFAHWLRANGLSDHEVAAVLGLERVRSVDRLLSHHHALNAQRQVREMFDN